MSNDNLTSKLNSFLTGDIVSPLMASITRTVIFNGIQFEHPLPALAYWVPATIYDIKNLCDGLKAHGDILHQEPSKPRFFEYDALRTIGKSFKIMSYFL